MDANDVVNWAGTGAAAHELPNLVRRLILATAVELSDLTVPGGSSVRLPGWDGTVRAGVGNVWVPEGNSVWELSCDGNVQAKANDDYQKRTENALGFDKSETTYVAVTARRFIRKADWERDRKLQGVWKDVKVVDADTLVAWFEAAPVVGEWFARLIGRMPDAGYTPLAQWWDGWISGTSPRITSELAVGGRFEESAEVGRRFRDGPERFYVRGYTQDEAIAFMAASALENEGGWGAEFLSRALVVHTSDSWRGLCGVPSALVLIRDFDRETIAVATERGHRTVIPLAEQGRTVGEGVSLPRLGREEAVLALQGMGMGTNGAASLSWRTGRRLPIIRRQIMDAAGQQALDRASAWVAPIVLLSQWEDDHRGDQEAIARLTGQPYDEVQRQVVELAGMPGAPVTKIGNRWRFLCQEDSWYEFGPKLTSSVLQRFRALAMTEFGVGGVSLAVGGDEDAEGVVLKCSSTLRRGIAEGLVVMALQPDVTLYGDECASIPRQLVSAALMGGAEVWMRLGQELAIIAEAAPGEFLGRGGASVER